MLTKGLIFLGLFLWFGGASGHYYTHDHFLCRPPAKSSDVRIHPRKRLYRAYDRITYSCHHGLKYKGATEAICLMGKFDIEPGKCIEPEPQQDKIKIHKPHSVLPVFCKVSEVTPENGSAFQHGHDVINNPNVAQGTHIVIKCKEGFKLAGNKINKCKKDGWLMERGMCVAIAKVVPGREMAFTKIGQGYRVEVQGRVHRLNVRVNGKSLV